MDYRSHYDRLIERSRLRVLPGYCERHHVIPRCLGGSNAPENIVTLTAEEHYVAHQLLVKMYPGDHRLLWAANAMSGSTRNQIRQNKSYGWLRKKLAVTLSARFKGKKHSAESRANMSSGQRARGPRVAHSDETRRKMSASSKGRKKSAEHCEALAAAKLGTKRGPQSELHLGKRVEATKRTKAGRSYPGYQSADYRSLQADRMRGVWQRRQSGMLPMPQYSTPK